MSIVITFEEAVEVLKTSKPTLYRWMADGQGEGLQGREGVAILSR